MFKFGVIGLGQGGSRMAKAVYDLQRRLSITFPVTFINSSEVDFREFEGRFFDDDKEGVKLLVGEGEGTGRLPKVGESFGDKDQARITKFLSHHFKDYKNEIVFIMVGAGGGTGGGMLFKVMDMVTALGMRPGVVFALPQYSEGIPALPNALKAISKLNDDYIKMGRVSPVILVDNEYMVRRFGIKGSFWDNVNNNVAACLLKLVLTIGDKSSMSTVGSLDENEIKRFLTFGHGFCDIREIEVTPASLDGLMTLEQDLESAKRFVEFYDLKGAKAHVLAVDVPVELSDALQKQVNLLLEKISTLFAGTLTLRGVFADSSLKDKFRVTLFLNGLTLPNNIKQLISYSLKDLKKYQSKFGIKKEKGVNIEKLNLSNVDDDFILKA